MAAIGRWMDVNSDGVYGTTASPFERPSWGRYTAKPGKLFAHVFEWPEDGQLATPLKSTKAVHAYLLADKEQKPLKAERTEQGALVHLPATPPDRIASVVVIEHE